MTKISREDFFTCAEALYSFCDAPCDRCPFSVEGSCKAALIATVLAERMNGEEEQHVH
jgi:hypothetical protein